jgi:Mn-dependent DtxR family transcriptional regulator
MIIETKNFPADMPGIQFLAMILIRDSLTDSLSAHALDEEMCQNNPMTRDALAELRNSGYVHVLSPSLYYALTPEGDALLESLKP